eukprot:349741-Chlamydomonas_euryale.AAC.7
MQRVGFLKPIFNGSASSNQNVLLVQRMQAADGNAGQRFTSQFASQFTSQLHLVNAGHHGVSEKPGQCCGRLEAIRTAAAAAPAAGEPKPAAAITAAATAAWGGHACTRAPRRAVAWPVACGRARVRRAACVHRPCWWRLRRPARSIGHAAAAPAGGVRHGASAADVAWAGTAARRAGGAGGSGGSAAWRLPASGAADAADARGPEAQQSSGCEARRLSCRTRKAMFGSA